MTAMRESIASLVTAKGARFDYGTTNPNSLVGKPMAGLGTSFSAPMHACVYGDPEAKGAGNF